MVIGAPPTTNHVSYLKGLAITNPRYKEFGSYHNKT